MTELERLRIFADYAERLARRALMHRDEMPRLCEQIIIMGSAVCTEHGEPEDCADEAAEKMRRWIEAQPAGATLGLNRDKAPPP